MKKTQIRFAMRHARSKLMQKWRAPQFALKLCWGLSLLSVGVSHHPVTLGAIVGEAGAGGVGGLPSGGRGGDGGDGSAALEITVSYMTQGNIVGGRGGGGGGGGGSGVLGNVVVYGMGGVGGKGGRGGHGIVIVGGNVVLHNDGWSISGGKSGGGGGGGGGLAFAGSGLETGGGRGGDGAAGEAGGAGGGGGGTGDLSGIDLPAIGGDGGNGQENGLPGVGSWYEGEWHVGGGSGGGGGGSETHGGAGGEIAYQSVLPGFGSLGGAVGGALGIDGQNGKAASYRGGGGGGGAPGGSGGNGGNTHEGGAGGSGGAAGASGYGVYVTGVNSVIINSGNIVQGGFNQSTAIKYAATASDSTLVLQGGGQIVGLVDATESDGTNTLVLDGGAVLAFDVRKIGNGAQAQYLGFDSFEKTSAGTWTLTGAPSQALTPWTLSGGWLAIADDTSLGGDASVLKFNGGGLQLDAGVTSQRDMLLAGDGAVHTAEGTVSMMQGSLSGQGALTKTGAGTWILNADNSFSGPMLIEDGVLQIGAGQSVGSLGTGAIENHGVLAINRAAPLTMSNAISGTGGLRQMGSGTTTLSGPLSYTGITRVDQGALVIDGTKLGRPDDVVARVVGTKDAYFVLANGARLEGGIAGPNVVIDASSQWHVATDSANDFTGNNLSTVNDLYLAGTVVLPQPAAWQLGAIGRTITAQTLVGAGGEMQLHTIPATDGSSDYVTLVEGATGLTNLSINSPGRLGDRLSGNGSLVIKAGASTDGAFQLTPGKPARGGAFNYSLAHGAQNGAPDLANNWYLISEARPEVSIYSQLGNQSLRQSELSVGTLNQRMGTMESLARKVYPFVWARTLGAYERRDGAPRGILQSQVASRSTLGGLQVGSDLFVVSKGLSRRSFGVFGSAMVSRNDVDHYRESTRSTIDAGRSDQTMYGLGAYYTRLDGKGGYADFVTQLSRYGVKTASNGLDGVSMRTSGWGGALSGEVGKAFTLGDQANGLRIEPQAQLMYQFVRLRDSEDDIGRVKLPAVHALHSRVTLMVSKVWGERADTQNQGWLALNYRHTLGKASSAYESLTQGDIAFDNDLEGSRLGLAVGFERQAGKTTFVNVQVNTEHGLGSGSGLRAVSGSLGIKHLF